MFTNEIDKREVRVGEQITLIGNHALTEFSFDVEVVIVANDQLVVEFEYEGLLTYMMFDGSVVTDCRGVDVRCKDVTYRTTKQTKAQE